MIWFGVFITCANVVGHTTVLLNKYTIHGPSKTISEWCEWNMILKSICPSWWDIFFPRSWENIFKKEKVCGIAMNCFNAFWLSWKLYLLCKQLLFLLSCEDQAISALFAELHFGSAQGPSSLTWSLSLHCLLEETLQILPIVCLLMEKKMEKQNRSGPIVYYEIFNWIG